ncbi:hypothetical protein [Streptomyces sp. GbtcB7]|nr:hypothetical protein [Streptomyces sp. GbtcB7]
MAGAFVYGTASCSVDGEAESADVEPLNWAVISPTAGAAASI